LYVKLTRRNKMIIAAITVAVVAPLAALLAVECARAAREGKLFEVPATPLVIPLDRRLNVLIAVTIIAALAPYTAVVVMNASYVSKIERDLPLFFRELAETVRSGVPLVRAVEEISARGAGPLRREMRRVVFRSALGEPFEESLRSFAERVDVYSTKVVSVILSEAYTSGARVVDVLETAGDVYSMLLAFELERRSKIAPYAWTIYISLILFLAISAVLTEIFFKPLSLFAAGIPFVRGLLKPEVYEVVFYYASLMESFFGGLIVGKMRTGRVSRGLIHSIILMAIAVTFYGAVLPLVSELVSVPLPKT